MNFDAKKAKDDCVLWIREWFLQNGKGCNAVIGISGGKDSTVAAALCAEALGKDRVVGVLMPNHIQPDIDDAIAVVKYLGIEYTTINIGPMIESIKMGISLGNYFGSSIVGLSKNGLSEQANTNLPPRIRMSILYAVSQSLNGRVVNTSNLSERYVGYGTRFGDTVGDVAPLMNLTKTEVVQIGHELGLPAYLVDKVPSDGLCGKTDEDSLGFTYEILDQYIRTGKIGSMEDKEKIDRLHKQNLFKMKPISKFELHAPIYEEP